MNSLTVVHLTWIDSESINEWCELEELNYSFSEVHSVGILIFEDEEKFILSVSYDAASDSANGIMLIPKAAVRKVETLCTIQMN